MKNYSLEEYITLRKSILSQLRVWEKMTKEEKERFKTATSQVQVNNIAINMRQKYL